MSFLRVLPLRVSGGEAEGGKRGHVEGIAWKIVARNDCVVRKKRPGRGGESYLLYRYPHRIRRHGLEIRGLSTKTELLHSMQHQTRTNEGRCGCRDLGGWHR